MGTITKQTKDKTYNKLKKVGNETRKYFQNELAQKIYSSGEKHLEGFCGHASIILFRRLKKLGMKPKIMEADEHWFVVCSGFIVDVTASQFGQSKVCVKRYSKIKQIIKSGEIKMSFWEARREHGGIPKGLYYEAIDIDKAIRTR